MPDREKILHELDHQVADADWCDNDWKDNVPIWMLRGALVLLREQEPRVMTLEDVKNFDWDYCYLEEERLPGKEYRAVCGDYALTCITWPCVTSMRIQHGDENYGKKWRCWTHKPTDEQRNEAKWDD